MDFILEKALTTLEEMLEDRKYNLIYNNNKNPDILNFYKTPSDKFCAVILISSTSQIKIYANLIFSEKYSNIIFIYKNNLTIAHKTIEKNLNYKIEIWSVFDLLINISKHEFQPKLEKKEDCSNISKRIPKISYYDPLIRYYGYKKKDVLKITDKNGFISYRLVV